MAVPVKGVGMAAADLRVHGAPRQAVLPEGGLQRGLEVRLVPDVAAYGAPVRMPGLEVCLVYGEAHGVNLRDEHGLAGNRVNVLGVNGFAKAHIVVAADGIPERF